MNFLYHKLDWKGLKSVFHQVLEKYFSSQYWCSFFFSMNWLYWELLVVCQRMPSILSWLKGAKKCKFSKCKLSYYFSFKFLMKFFPTLIIKSPKQKFGRLIVFAPFLIIIILILILILILLLLLSFRAPWTCPRQISGTTGQNFMKLGGVIDICF